MSTNKTPVIVGAGLAGLSAALSLAPCPVMVIGRKPCSNQTSSELAQGGMAAAVGSDDDVALHAQDTWQAGASCGNREIIDQLTSAGPSAVEQLLVWGVPFDRKEDGSLVMGLEAAHGKRRIVHAKGDSTGAVIMQTLVQRVKETPSITLIDGEVQELLQDSMGAITGVIYFDHSTQHYMRVETDNVVLATGSAAALWKDTTVPLASWGSGLLLAAQAGARLKDLEFVQFHPTALDVGLDPMPLVSEAVRGEGAFLVNDKGERFINPLAPRDVVARAVFAQRESGNMTYLDARAIPFFAKRFPTVFAACDAAGIDPQTDLIPIKPVTHYHMGGIETDAQGRTNVEGLWACGECACTGFHGANRLASNSLLEATLMGRAVAEALVKEIDENATVTVSDMGQGNVPKGEDGLAEEVRAIMSSCVGVCRTHFGLEHAIDVLRPMVSRSRRAQLGLWIAKAALRRPFSLGAHYRTDTQEMTNRLVS